MTDAPPDEDAAPNASPLSRIRVAVPAWGVVAVAVAALAAAILPPVAEDGLVALLDDRAQGVDPIVTGTAVVAPQRRYTIHRSVLQSAGETCTVFADGRALGAC